MLSHEQDVHAGGHKNKIAIKNKTMTNMKCFHHYGDDEEEVVDQPGEERMFVHSLVPSNEVSLGLRSQLEEKRFDWFLLKILYTGSEGLFNREEKLEPREFYITKIKTGDNCPVIVSSQF